MWIRGDELMAAVPEHLSAPAGVGAGWGQRDNSTAQHCVCHRLWQAGKLGGGSKTRAEHIFLQFLPGLKQGAWRKQVR